MEDDESSYIRILDVDEKTIDLLQQVAALDKDQPEIALEAIGGNEEMLRAFGKETGASNLPQFQELLRLIKIRDHAWIGSKHSRETSNPVQSSSFIALKPFLVGLGFGIGLGILFAPMSGEETRDNLRQRAIDLADSARDLVDQGRERVRNTVSAIRGEAERYTGADRDAAGTGVVRGR